MGWRAVPAQAAALVLVLLAVGQGQLVRAALDLNLAGEVAVRFHVAVVAGRSMHASRGCCCQCTGVPMCGDVDELPAYGPAEQWAALFEVIAPYHKLCRVPVPANYTTRVRLAGRVAAAQQFPG